MICKPDKPTWTKRFPYVLTTEPSCPATAARWIVVWPVMVRGVRVCVRGTVAVGRVAVGMDSVTVCPWQALKGDMLLPLCQAGTISTFVTDMLGVISNPTRHNYIGFQPTNPIDDSRWAWFYDVRFRFKASIPGWISVQNLSVWPCIHPKPPPPLLPLVT